MSRGMSGFCRPLAVSLVVVATSDAMAQQPTAFRVDTNLIAVDVQVIDSKGVPVAGLVPEDFEVRVNGRTRRVVSAQLIGNIEALNSPSAPNGAPLAQTVAASTPAVSDRPRVFVVALDTASVDHGTSRGLVVATEDFVRRLPASDYVGLVAYPDGVTIDPTLDRGALRRALGEVVGTREPSSLPLTPKEVLSGTGGEYALRRCGSDIGCQRMVELQVLDVIGNYESLAKRSLTALRGVLSGLAEVDGRKTLVLVSGGMVAAATPAGRPSVGDLGTVLGQDAARTNTNIYTLFVDWRYLESVSASRGGAPSSFSSQDSRVLSGWLEKFTDAAGGKLFTVFAGSGEFAFDAIIRETAAYYLLGVEPTDEDRDGEPRQLRVRLPRKGNVSVRSRSWVSVPTR